MTFRAFQYVVLRCVPDADREEFVNVGVVLYCEDAGFLEVDWHVDPARMRALNPTIEVAQVESALIHAREVCQGIDAGAVDQPLGRRFGMLKAPRSTVLQPGPVHGGITEDPAAELAALLARLVSR